MSRGIPCSFLMGPLFSAITVEQHPTVNRAGRDGRAVCQLKSEARWRRGGLWTGPVWAVLDGSGRFWTGLGGDLGGGAQWYI